MTTYLKLQRSLPAMLLAQVVGTVVCTQKDPHLKGIKLLVVQRVNEAREVIGHHEVAVDALGTTGPGELVYLATKKEAAHPFEGHFLPVDLAIIGHVEGVNIPDPALVRG